MMTLPPIPPSDNLYKFTAIGGLMLIALASYASLKMDADVTIASIETLLKQKELSIELLRIEAAQKDLIERDLLIGNEMLQAAMDDKSTEGDKENRFNKAKQELLVENRRKFEELRKDVEHSILIQTQNTAEVEKFLALSSLADKIVSISKTLFWSGLILTLYGFSNWHWKFQRFQDQIVKAQAEQWTKPKPQEGREKEEIPG